MLPVAEIMLTGRIPVLFLILEHQVSTFKVSVVTVKSSFLYLIIFFQFLILKIKNDI